MRSTPSCSGAVAVRSTSTARSPARCAPAMSVSGESPTNSALRGGHRSLRSASSKMPGAGFATPASADTTMSSTRPPSPISPRSCAARRPSSTPPRSGCRGGAAGPAPARHRDRAGTGSSCSSASVSSAVGSSRCAGGRCSGAPPRIGRADRPARLRRVPPCGGRGSRPSRRASPAWPAARRSPLRAPRARPAGAATAARARPACRARRTGRPRTRRLRRRGGAPALRPRRGPARRRRCPASATSATASTRTGMPFRCAMPASRSRCSGPDGASWFTFAPPALFASCQPPRCPQPCGSATVPGRHLVGHR